jgi:hypothetical protein
MKYIKKFHLFERFEIDKSGQKVSDKKEKLFDFLEDEGFVKTEKEIEIGFRKVLSLIFQKDDILIILPKGELEDRHYISVRKTLYNNGIIEDEKEFDSIFDENDENNNDLEFDEDNNDLEFDLDFAMAKIKEQFDEDNVVGMFDEEVLAWVDSDWQDDYESEYDWYVDHNNGEAQDSVISQIIRWFETTYNQSLLSGDIDALTDAIKEEYDTLNY